MKHVGVLSSAALALLWSVPQATQAAALVAGSILNDVGSLGSVVYYLMIIVGAVLVLGLSIESFSDIKRGDLTDGIKGAFIAVFAAVVIFVIIKGLVGGELAAAATLR